MVLFNDWISFGRILVIGTGGCADLIAILRVSGKRTLSKRNAFDFAVLVGLQYVLEANGKIVAVPAPAGGGK